MQVLTSPDTTDTLQTRSTGVAMLTPLSDMVLRGLLSEGLDGLFAVLEQACNAMEPERWKTSARGVRTDPALSHLIYQDPLTRRAFDKPRGYAGDAVMMDYVYGIHFSHEASAQASALGRRICEYIQRRPAGLGVRHRREHIAQLIDELAARVEKPDVLAVAAGHLREAELASSLASRRTGRFVALDSDAESLREVAAHYSALGVETVNASVRNVLARKVKLGSFDFVYAAGLYDYLNAATAAALTARLFERAKPGGQVLIPNFAPSCPDRGYMEAFMDWDLVYRDEFDMSKLVERIPREQVASYDIYSDPSGSIVYLLICKS